MDQTTNPFQRFLDLKDQDFQLTPFEHQDKYFLFENHNQNENQYAQKNQEKNQFFTSSPNPFLKQCPNFSHFNSTPQKNIKNSRSRHFIDKKLCFQQLQIQSPLKSYTLEKFQKDNQQNQYSCKKQFEGVNQEEYSHTDKFNNTQKKVKKSQFSKQDENYDQKMKKTKQAKGLKGLSQNVYEIVKHQGVTSYNKVASILIQQMKLNSKIYGHIFDSRDQQNIKRRVYDALNVLISAQVLKKDNKSVTINKELFTDSIFSRLITQSQKKLKAIKRDSVQTKKLLIEQVKLKNYTLKSKEETFKKLLLKKRKIESFIKKNMLLTENQFISQIGPSSQKDIKKQQQKKESHKQKIYFPFICLNIQSSSKTKIKYTAKVNDSKNNIQSKTTSVWEKQNSSTQDSFILTNSSNNKNSNQASIDSSISMIIKADLWTIFGDVDFIIEGNYGQLIKQQLVKDKMENLKLQDDENELQGFKLDDNQKNKTNKVKIVEKLPKKQIKILKQKRSNKHFSKTIKNK